MIKTLIFDLDGTLLNSRKEISHLTGEALLTCTNKGIKILHATARPPLLHRMLKIEKKYLSLINKYEGVYYNGGCVINDGEKNYKFISQNIIGELLENIISKWGSCINVSIQMENEEHSFYRRLPREEYPLWGIDDSLIIDFGNSLKKKIVKVIIYSISGNRTGYPYPPIQNSCSLEDIYIYIKNKYSDSIQLFMTDDKNVLQIMSATADKLTSIKEYIETCSLNPDEIAVFGDDYPDLKMLQEFKYSFAMSNAKEEVKRAAKFILKSNDEDGIYYALRDILNLIN